MNKQEMLQNAVNDKLTPVYMTDYGQIKEYLIEKHGQRGWIGAMAQMMSGSASRAKSDKPYQAARRSIERFEKGQFKSMKSRDVKDVGKQLPPIGKVLKGDITITVKANQKDGRKGTRDRSFTATFTGMDAQNFVREPTFRDIYEQLDYPEDVIDMFEDGDYELDIYSVA